MNTQQLEKIIEIYNNTFDLKKIWKESNQGEKNIDILDNFLDELNISKDKNTRYIAYQRIVNLKEEPLKLYLEQSIAKIKSNTKKLKVDIPNKLEDTEKILKKAYQYTKNIYETYQSKFIENIKNENFLNNFDLALLEGTFKVGLAFNNFMPVWQEHIEKQNKVLDKLFNYDKEKVIKYLEENNLFEVDENGNRTDRSYSVIKGKKILTYYEAFPTQIQAIINSLTDFIDNLKNIEHNYQEVYVEYLQAIKDAFSEKYTTKLLKKWQNVDKKWINIKYPIQIVHPLEYYEDKYRQAVAPEWDIRVIDNSIFQSTVKKNIENMYEKIFSSIGKEKYIQSYNFGKHNIDKVQLYISQPIMFFGAFFNGLFSAQVVPNDETVSSKYGKKIFAFPENVLEQQKIAPITKLTKQIFKNEFIKTI